MNRIARARLIRGALNAVLIGLSVILVAVAALYFWFDDPVTRMPPKESIPADLPPKLAALIENLYSTDEDITFSAIWELGYSREESAPAVPFLVPFLGDNRVPVARPDFSFSLSYLHDTIWPPKAEHWVSFGTKAATFGTEAASTLSRIGPSAVEPLGTVLLRSRSPLARENAAKALVDIGRSLWAPSPFPESASERVTELLVKAFQQDAVPLAPIADGLLWSGALLPPQRLVDVMRNAEVAADPWSLAREQLLRDPRSVLPMAAARTDRDSRIRKLAVGTLHELAEACKVPAAGSGWHADDETAAPLAPGEFPLAGFVGLLKDPDPTVRCCAVYALGWWGEPSAVAPLVPALNDADSGVRLQAACWLARLGDGRGIEALAVRLHDEEPDARSAAFEVLSRLDDDRAIEPLLEAEQDPSLHWAALAALADFHRSPAVARYIAALRDPSPAARTAAHRALVLITWEDFGEDADAWAAWWQKHKTEP